MQQDLPPDVRREELARDNRLRRELDEARPSLGWAAVMIAAILVVVMGVFLLGSPVGDTPSSVASRDLTQTQSPSKSSTDQ